MYVCLPAPQFAPPFRANYWMVIKPYCVIAVLLSRIVYTNIEYDMCNASAHAWHIIYGMAECGAAQSINPFRISRGAIVIASCILIIYRGEGEKVSLECWRACVHIYWICLYACWLTWKCVNEVRLLWKIN